MNKYTFIFKCPICHTKEKITVYREEIEQSKDKLKTVIISHRDMNPPHDVLITVDINGHIRSIYVKRIDRMESAELKHKVELKIYPIVIKSDAQRKRFDDFTMKVLELSNGFNTIDDIARELGVSKMLVIEKIGELRSIGYVSLVYTISVSTEEVII